jgi:hypothetical protein
VLFGVIGVPFRRGEAASSARSVAISFIHTNDMPISGTCRLPLGHEMGGARSIARRIIERAHDLIAKPLTLWRIMR